MTTLASFFRKLLRFNPLLLAGVLLLAFQTQGFCLYKVNPYTGKLDYYESAGSSNAATATALAANGSNCSSGQSPLGVDAHGASEGCFDVTTQAEFDADVNQDLRTSASPSFAAATIGSSSGFVTANAGLITVTAIADDQVLVGDTATSGSARTIPNCTDATGNHLNYNQSTNTFSCGTSSSTASGWSYSSPNITLATSTDNVGIGGTPLGKLSITGDTDEIQLNVRFNATNTALGVVFELSDGTDVYTWAKDGTYTQAGTATPAMSLGGGAVSTYVTTYDLSGTDVVTTAGSGTFGFNSAVTATSFNGLIPVVHGSNPTTDAAGKFSIDTSATSGAAFRFYADAAYELHAWRQKSFVIMTPVATDDYVVWRLPYAITIKAIHVLCTGGTNIIGGLDEGDANGANVVAVDADITGTAGTMAADDGSLTNPTIAATGTINWHTTSISSTPTSVMVTVDYTEDQVN